MKFDYETSSEDREVVAIIDGDGDLSFNDADGHMVTIYTDGTVTIFESLDLDWSMEAHGCLKKFYKGDKLTITF